MYGQKALYTGLDEYVDKGLRRWIAEVTRRCLQTYSTHVMNIKFLL